MINNCPYLPGFAGGGGGGGGGGGCAGGASLSFAPEQPKDMEINIDRHKDRRTKAILLFVDRFIVLTTCQNQLQFLNGVFPFELKNLYRGLLISMVVQ